MGLMMWVMMRGGRHSQVDDSERIANLEQEIADLKAHDAAAPDDRHLTAAGR
jgi:hypothetical protein